MAGQKWTQPEVDSLIGWVVEACEAGARPNFNAIAGILGRSPLACRVKCFAIGLSVDPRVYAIRREPPRCKAVVAKRPPARVSVRAAPKPPAPRVPAVPDHLAALVARRGMSFVAELAKVSRGPGEYHAIAGIAQRHGMSLRQAQQALHLVRRA